MQEAGEVSYEYLILRKYEDISLMQQGNQLYYERSSKWPYGTALFWKEGQ